MNGNNTIKETEAFPSLLQQWKEEESIAYIHGWDFSHIEGRYTQQDFLPWDYQETILSLLQPQWKLLDTDTGGGEFLLSLGHPYGNTAATENYLPNVQLCRNVLLPLGIDFRSADAAKYLPYPDESFHMVINRHGDFSPSEIYRVLKPGGYFITQQVGAENDRELVQLLCGSWSTPFPEQYLSCAVQKFQETGFRILRQEESFQPIRFYDSGALVWFARIIQWEFPNFSVDTHLDGLLQAESLIQSQGFAEGTTHRFFLAAQKPHL